MQQSINPGAAGNENAVNAHHDILSVNRKPTQGLLEHLNTGLPNPLDLLFNDSVGISSQPGVLDNIVLEPADPPLPTPPPVATPEPQNGMVTLEQDVRLSECMLWQLLIDYYSRLGINAWQSGIPNFITSSAYTAECYAEIILAYLEDDYAALDLSEPIYIVELATGPGRFSFYLIRELERKLACFTKFRDLKFRYVMTDFTEENPKFWEQHAKLKPLVEKGILDFAVLNPLTDCSFETRIQRETFAPGKLKNPMITIANYFFDSVPQEMFRVENKKLKEGRMTIQRNMEGVEPGSPVHIQQLVNTVQFVELPNANYYADQRLNQILNHYRHNISNGSIIFPVGALDVIRNMQKLANNRLVLLSSDKSYTMAQDMIRFYHHDYCIHDGAFSYMVNYDALMQYFRNGGGQVFHTQGRSLGLHTVCMIEMNRPETQFERLAYFFKEELNRAQTINSLCSTMPNKNTGSDIDKVHSALGTLRLNLGDPYMFVVLGQQLVDTVAQAYVTQQEDLKALMKDTWENWYFYPGEQNTAFWFGQIYFMMGMYRESIECMETANQLYGRHEVLYFLQGQSHEKLQQWEKAKERYQLAVEVKPDFAEAWNSLSNVEEKLAAAS